MKTLSEDFILSYIYVNNNLETFLFNMDFPIWAHNMDRNEVYFPSPSQPPIFISSYAIYEVFILYKNLFFLHFSHGIKITQFQDYFPF